MKYFFVVTLPLLIMLNIAAINDKEFDADLFYLKGASSSDIFKRNCISCHSSDYIFTQAPDMPRFFWERIVMKMKNVYSAPIADVEIEPVVDYLVQINSTH